MRDIAVKLYERWIRNMTRIDTVVQTALEQYNWDPRDKGLFQEIMYGTVRWHGRLQWILIQVSSRSKKPEPLAAAAAVIGIYQLLFLDRVPAYAAVDSSVNIARFAGGDEAAGWVNAVLRRVSKDPQFFRDLKPESSDPLHDLALVKSFPDWMVYRWSNLMSREKLETFLDWSNRRPGLSIRVNTLVTTRQAVEDVLRYQEIPVNRSQIDDRFLEVEGTGDILDLEIFREGWFSVQDPGQGLVARLADPKAGETVLDLCSAPGGKTGYLAELCPDCKIIATDSNPDRLPPVTETVERCGYKNVEIREYDELINSRDARYDVILVDAPCTGTGVLCRRPDLRWRRTPDEIRRMTGIQLQLLRYAADHLTPTGRIIYSTCSIEPEENDELVELFLHDHRGLQIAPIGDLLPADAVVNGNRVKLFGQELATDGVFAIRIERKPDGSDEK